MVQGSVKATSPNNLLIFFGSGAGVLLGLTAVQRGVVSRPFFVRTAGAGVWWQPLNWQLCHPASPHDTILPDASNLLARELASW